MKNRQLIQCEELLDEARHCMARVMDDCELELGDSPRWKFLRSRLLKIFGERGLQGRILEIMSSSETT
jgi:hypothetical protein